jgi:hypothetical protein
MTISSLIATRTQHKPPPYPSFFLKPIGDAQAVYGMDI